MSMIVVERVFEEAQDVMELNALEEKNVSCLESRDVHFVRSIVTLDKKRLFCIYEAPDTESVREAQREAGLPFVRAWAVTELH